MVASPARFPSPEKDTFSVRGNGVRPSPKASINDFAIFGGTPAFQEPLHVGRPNIGNRQRFLDRLNDVLDSQWLTNNGPYVQELEQKISAFIGVKHCIATCNGTIALELAIRASGLEGEVIVPSYTFIATAHALQWQEITPVFCDIDPATHNIDPDQIEKMITPRTTGIMGVHLWGRPCDVVRLTQIARKHDLKLLFDAAHAFGCSYQGKMLGNFGQAEVFSFHATKFFNTFEGGAVVTNDDDLAARLRLMRNFGLADHEHTLYVGTNGKMSEVSAVMGLTLLEDLDELIHANYLNYHRYKHFLEHVPGIQLMAYDEAESNNYQYIVLEVDENIAGISAENLVAILNAENVLARRYFFPGCHRMEPYRSHSAYSTLQLPQTERVAERVFCLPTGTSVDEGRIHTICQIIRLAVQYGTEVCKRLDNLKSPRATVY